MSACIAALLLSICSLHVIDGPKNDPAAANGTLVIVGGGTIDQKIAHHIIEIVGGTDAPMLIIPFASERPEAGEESAKAWQERGMKNIRVLSSSKPRAADTSNENSNESDSARQPLDPTSFATIDASTGAAKEAIHDARFIWMSGGDQNRLVKSLRDYGLIEAIRERFAAGACVGGTSAGAAAVSTIMLTGESKLDQIAVEPGDLAEGLGLWPGVLVDQHFVARQRFNRLLGAIITHPDLVGVGIDESTAVVVQGSKLNVFGNGQVVIIDARHSNAEVKQSKPYAAAGIELHVLKDGMGFDLKTQKSAKTPTSARIPSE